RARASSSRSADLMDPAPRASLLPDSLDPGAVRAAVMDLDGTVLDATFKASGRTANAIAAAEASGITCLIATGRMFQSARRIAATLGVHGPLICYQGGMVGDPATGEILLHRPLEVPLAL